MEFTDEELQFLQRLIGHHLTANSTPKYLYNKIADAAEFRGIASDNPLPLEMSDSPFYKDRMILSIQTEDWFE